MIDDDTLIGDVILLKIAWLKFKRSIDPIISGIGHFFWLLGVLYLNILKLNFKEAVDTYYWIRIHILYRGMPTGKRYISVQERIKITLYQLAGLLLSIVILYVLIITLPNYVTSI